MALLLKLHVPAPYLGSCENVSSDSVDRRWGPQFGISDDLIGDADAVYPGTRATGNILPMRVKKSHWFPMVYPIRLEPSLLLLHYVPVILNRNTLIFGYLTFCLLGYF